MKSIEIFVRAATNADCKAVETLVFSVLHEYGLHPDPHGTDADILDIESNYLARGGSFEVLENVDGVLLGTVGLYPLDNRRVEIRKMYFSPTLRGQGEGKKTLRRTIAKAQELGFTQIYLETASVLREAIGLYRSFGFQPSTEIHTPRCDQAFALDIS